MKFRTTLALVAFVVSTPAFAADPVVGLFKTQPGDNGNFALVEMSECGNEICGVIRQTYDGSGAKIKSDNIGKRIVWAMQPKGDGSYSKGKIWAPDRDKTYKSKMVLEGKRLKVSGCVAFICRSQIWMRVK